MNLEHIYEFFRHRPPTYLGQELAVCYVLSVLVEKESYGTELIALLETEHPGYRLSDTVLYSAIKFLEDEKAITGYWKKVQGRGRPRRRYRPLSVRPFSAPLRPQHRQADQAQPAAVLHGLLRHRPLPRIRGQRRLHPALRHTRRRDEELLTDDTELMLFGFRFLKQVLFGENTIKIHEETAAKRMEIAEKKLQQLEAEAREKRAADGDGMYDDDE